MNKGVERLLKEVVDEHGVYDCINRERCVELMSSKYGAFRDEFIPLAEAAEYGVLLDLIKFRYQYDSERVKELLSSRLMVRMNIPIEQSRWILNVWAYALGINSESSDKDKKRFWYSKRG